MANTTPDLVAAGRAHLSTIGTKMDAITNSGFRGEDNQLVVTPKARAEFKSLLAEANEVRGDLRMLEGKSLIAREATGQSDADSPANQPSAAWQGMPGGIGAPMEVKSIGQIFTESAAFSERTAGGSTAPVEVDGALVAAQYKDLHSGSAGSYTAPGFGTVQRAPMVAIPQRAARVRDLFPQATTTASMIEYIIDRGFVVPGDNAAAFVGELATGGLAYQQKPKSNIRFDLETAMARTIAHWIPAHRNVLADEPVLRSMIDTRLIYGLKLAEDRALLLGSGTGNEIQGVFGTDGVQIYEGPLPGATSGINKLDNYVDTLRRAVTRVMLADYEATGIVMNPLDWEKTELTKGSDGQYVLVGNAAVGADQRVWRLPVVATAACPEGTALVGAFGLGAQVFDREAANIRTAEQHAELFTANAVAILAEERLALCVYRPESFVKVHFAGTGV